MKGKIVPTTSTTEHDPRFDSKQAAEYIGVTAGTLSVSRCTKSIPISFHKVGKKCVYLKSDLDAYLQSVRVER